MAGEVLNMSILALNKNRYKLKVLYFKNRHKTIYLTLATRRKPTAPLSTFSFSPDTKTNTKKPKKLKVLPPLTKQHGL